MKQALVDVSVLILFFNRPDPLKQVFAQVQKARPARLFLYQDGPRSKKDMEGLLACREVVSKIDWDCEVHQLYQERNYGCDPSEFISQKWAFSQTDKCVVLEDDDVPAVSFFSFCKEMMDRYENDERIMASDLFSLYSRWAKRNNEYEMTSKKFFREVSKKLPEKGRCCKGIFYSNIRLTEYAEELEGVRQYNWQSFN